MLASRPLRRGVEFAVDGAIGGFLSLNGRCSVPALEPCIDKLFDNPLLVNMLVSSLLVESKKTYVSGVFGEKLGAAALSLAAPVFVGRTVGNFGVAAVGASLSPYHL